jgi:transposase InsO family protein
MPPNWVAVALPGDPPDLHLADAALGCSPLAAEPPIAPRPTKKGTGFEQPLRVHEHWHVDIAYLNLAGTFYSLCSVLDGCSRSTVHREIRETMKEEEVQQIIQRARERFPGVTPRIISDDGPQFVAREFKEFIRLCSMTHVKTSPYYPPSNGKIERSHKALKGD